MPWIQIRLHTDADHVNAVEDAALAAGALAVTFEDSADQPIFEPPPGETPLWQDIRLTALFDAEIDSDAAVETIRSELAGYMPQFKVEILEDKDWIREWMKSYKPMQFGNRLWICPSWCEPPAPDAINLLLDPGLAFGTGTHPTTALCLQWLDGHDMQGKTVVDFGCGSGILAIAALLLGADKVIGIDIDPQAVTATHDNAKRNGVDDQRLEVYLPENAPVIEADIVLANILAGPLLQLKDQLSTYLKPGGELILSGLLESQAEEIKQHYADEFDFAPTQQREEWVRLDAKKRA